MPWLIVAGLGGLGWVLHEARGAVRDAGKTSPALLVVGGLVVLSFLRRR